MLYMGYLFDRSPWLHYWKDRGQEFPGVAVGGWCCQSPETCNQDLPVPYETEGGGQDGVQGG